MSEVATEIEVSVVIPCFRSRETIGRTLQSIFKQDYTGAMEVIVADSSDDDTAEWIDAQFPQVLVHHSSERLLPGPARNFGVSKARGRLIAFIDADAEAAPNWLSTLRKRLNDDPNVVMAGAAIANANPETAPSRVLYWLEFSEFLPRQPPGFRKILSSSNLLIRRQDFQRVNGFDPKYGMSEDMVFSLALGRGLFLETATQIRHRHRADWPKVQEHLHKLGYWSGRFRTTFAVSGSWLRSVPWLSFGLTPYRLYFIGKRIVQHEPRPLAALRDLPRLIAGLWSWNRGFREGLSA